MSLARANGNQRCMICDRDVTDRPISASVGLGGGNAKADVTIIQQFLNSLSTLEGGPAMILAEDGICGPKTRAAISKYQTFALGWSDGRIDPQGKTIKALTGYICDSPTVLPGSLGLSTAGRPAANAPNTSPPAPGSDGALFLTIAYSCLRVMEPSLGMLRWKLVNKFPPIMALLQKHFGTASEKVTNADAAHVENVLSRIHAHMARANAFGKMSFENIILYETAPAGNDIAFTVRGGDKMSTKQFQIYVDKGIARKYPGFSIWLTSIYGDQPSHEKHWTVLHEFCHFVGPRDGFPATIDDHGYAFEAKFGTLGKFKRLHNAESLSLFFLEWCFGTEAILRLPRLSMFTTHFGASPKVVVPGHEIVMS
jgi:hypothetical protein